jgi:Pyruvate/2-oxoglutarate dehydrogenase complex, dehydrogenase (E1) component, eukaryotic type, alpha subunit
VPGYVVDGQDVLAVYAVTKQAVDRARNGEGPTLIEAKTYRFYDHAMFAGAKVGQFGAFGLPYRSDKDVHAWIANDPIEKFRATLIALGVLTNEQADEMVQKVKDEVLASFEYARQSPDPDEDAGLANVYAEGKVAASQFFA